MPTNKETYKAKMDALVDSINEKAGTSGLRDIDEMKSAVDSIPTAPATPDYVYQCTGTADDTAIVALLDAFFATDKTSYRLDIIGDFGGTGTMTIAPQTDKKQAVYLNFAGCNTGSALEMVTINVPTNSSVHLSNLKSYESFIFVLSGSGKVFFDNCEIKGAGTGSFNSVYITNNSNSNLYINNSDIGQNAMAWDSPTFFKNYGSTFISNSQINGYYTNESGSLILSNCKSLTRSYILNKSVFKAENCIVYADLDNSSSAEMHFNNCNVYGANKPVTYAFLTNSSKGYLYFTGCYLRGGNPTSGVGNAPDCSLLIIDNCYVTDNTRICCFKASTIVKITNSIFKSSETGYSSGFNGGGLILGTDNATIPKFYVSGNTFETSCVRIGGNDVTYVTADNGHYMPEFANTFAEVTP